VKIAQQPQNQNQNLQKWTLLYPVWASSDGARTQNLGGSNVGPMVEDGPNLAVELTGARGSHVLVPMQTVVEHLESRQNAAKGVHRDRFR